MVVRLASLGLVGILESRSSLRQRIGRHLDFHPPRKAGLTLGSALAVLGFAALAVPMGEARAQSGASRAAPRLLTTNSLVPDGLSSPARQGEQQPLYVRTFKIDTNTLIQGLKIALGPLGTHSSDSFVPAVLDWLQQAGVDLDPARNPGKAAFYGDRKGLLLVRASLRDLDIIERKIAELKGQLTLVPPPLLPEVAVGNEDAKVKAGKLVRDGKLLYEMGKLDEAEAKLKPALKHDPHNAAALYYLNLVAEAKYRRAAESRQVVEQARTDPVKRELLPVPNPFPRTNLVYTNLYVRTFKVDQNVLLESLHLPKGAAETTSPEAIARAFRDQLTRAGVDMDPMKNPGKALFYNDRQSLFIIRATMQDLDLIEAALQVLMAPPDEDSGIPKTNPGHSTTNAPQSSVLVQGRPIADWVKETEIGLRPGKEGERALGVLQSAGPRIMPQLSRLLREDESPEIQAKAAWTMSIIGYRNPDATEVHNAVPVLTTAAQNKNSEVRIYSVQALGAIGRAASNAAPELIQLTRDQNDGVRMSAVEALGRIGVTSP